MKIGLFVFVFALIGAPVFAVMAGVTELAWLTHANPGQQFVRFLAPDVLDERFAGSPILVTVPLFTFIGYVLAESDTPKRLVRASNALLGWLPGGLAMVCILASAFFTTLTGGSAVTIVAIGGLLYPALRQQGYPERFSLGLVMTGGSLGLLLPPSLPILVYSLVAGIDFTKAFKAGVLPGVLVMALLGIYSFYIGIKAKVPRSKFDIGELFIAGWKIKWELFIPVLILGGLFTGTADIDEIAAVAALYVVVIEVFVYKDLKVRAFPAIIRSSMALAGAILLIMAFAMSLTNFIISEEIPAKIFRAVTDFGVTETWQFLITLNIFLYIQGMFMDGFSSILVAVPLLIPFAAMFGLSPFHLAMMFLLNLEIAYLSPPLGQNLFVASFRFNRPMIQLYRIAIPFLGILIVGLILVMTIPWLSTVAVQSDIADARALAVKNDEAPTEAWLMECVQEDRNNPLPCDEAEKKKYSDLFDEDAEQAAWDDDEDLEDEGELDDEDWNDDLDDEDDGLDNDDDDWDDDEDAGDEDEDAGDEDVADDDEDAGDDDVADDDVADDDVADDDVADTDAGSAGAGSGAAGSGAAGAGQH